MDTADVLIHIDEKIDHDRRVGIVDSLNANSGVRDVKSSDEKPHILIVKYDPTAVTSHELLDITLASGVHAELIGF